MKGTDLPGISRESAEQSLSEYLHRTKLTSMLMATLSFGVSLPGAGPFKNLKIFDVTFAGLNDMFVVVTLAFASSYCFVVFIAQWRAEAGAFLERTIPPGSKMIDSVNNCIRMLTEGVSEINQTTVALKNFSLDHATLRKIEESGAIAMIPAFTQYFASYSGSSEDIRNESRFAEFLTTLRCQLGQDVIPQLFEDEDIRAYALRAFKRTVGDEFSKRCSELREVIDAIEEPGWLTSEMIQISVSTGSQSLPTSLSSIRVAIKELSKQRKLFVNRRRSEVVRIYGLDMLVPVFLYVVAMLHVFGRIAYPVFISLPEAIVRITGA